MIRYLVAPWLTFLAAAAALPLIGCVKADADLGAAHRQNLALQRGSDDRRMPLAGGSGVGSVAAIKRYYTGTVYKPFLAPAGAAAGGSGGGTP